MTEQKKDTTVTIEGKEYTVTINQDGTLKGVPVKPKHWVPADGENYYSVWGTGRVGKEQWLSLHLPFHNLFPTSDAAHKAAELMRRSNAIIRACLLVDPDFVPTFKVGVKSWIPVFCHTSDRWKVVWNQDEQYGQGHVSTYEKCEEVCRLLTEWGVK